MSWTPTPAMIEEIRSLAASGHNDSEIGTHFGVKGTSVEYWRSRSGIANGYVRPKKEKPPEGFFEIAPTLTKAACAKHFNVAPATARRWYRKTGIVAASRSYGSSGADIAQSPAKRRAWRASSYIPTAPVPQRDTSIAGRAQLFLQRFGPVVRASVINPKASGWLVFGRAVSEDDMVRAACRKGFQASEAY